MTQDSSFPIDDSIEHNGRLLHITKLLSDRGLTSRVYEGWLEDENAEKIHVAVKSMKHLDFPMARQYFEQEGGTLTTMMHYEKLANQEQRIDLKVAPVFFGSGEFDDIPYLVMEFVAGKELPELIELNGGKLPESQALTIGWHLFRTLDILHSRLKKSYADLKYENLWWVSPDGSEDNGQLKMMDFGTMEDIQAGEGISKGEKRDLLQAGVYLCHMLTGQMPNYSMAGFLKERAEPIIRNAQMSWGTQQLLYQLLHRNPQARPTDVSALVSEFRTLVSFWTNPVTTVLDLAQQLLASAESSDEPSKAHDQALRARAALDIVSFRDHDVDGMDIDIERAEKILLISDYLERGKTLLRTRSADLARKTFEEGMHWSNDPGTLRRWAYLARVGEEVSPSVFDEHLSAAIEMVEWMNDGDWVHALERLEALRPNLESEGLNLIFCDIKMFEQINAAREVLSGPTRDFLSAANHYREAMQWMKKLPDEEFIKEEEEGDLFLLAREMELRHQSEGEARENISMVQTLLQSPEPEIEKILLSLEKAIDLAPENDVISAELIGLIQQALKNNNFSLAFQMGAIGLRKGINHPEIFSIFQLSRQLNDAERALVSRQKKQFQTTLREVRTSFGSESVADTCITALRDRAGQYALASKDSAWLSELAQFADEQNDWDQAKLWRDEANRLMNARDENIRQTIDRLISDATCLLQINEFNPENANDVVSRYSARKISSFLNEKKSRYIAIDQMVSDAEQLNKEIDHRSEDVSLLRQRIDQLLDGMNEQNVAWREVVKSENQARLSVLNNLWDRLQTFLEWGRKADQAGARGLIMKQISQQAEEEAMEIIRQCNQYLATIDGSNEEVVKLLNEIHLTLDNLGRQSWESFRKLADQRTEEIHQQFVKAHRAYEQGELEQANSELDILAPDYSLAAEWIELKTRVTQVEMLYAWQDEHKNALENGEISTNMLHTLREFISLGMPSPYYRGLSEYLQNAFKSAEQKIDATLNRPESQEFVEALRFWVNVQLTKKMLESMRQ